MAGHFVCVFSPLGFFLFFFPDGLSSPKKSPEVREGRVVVRGAGPPGAGSGGLGERKKAASW